MNLFWLVVNPAYSLPLYVWHILVRMCQVYQKFHSTVIFCFTDRNCTYRNLPWQYENTLGRIWPCTKYWLSSITLVDIRMLKLVSSLKLVEFNSLPNSSPIYTILAAWSVSYGTNSANTLHLYLYPGRTWDS